MTLDAGDEDRRHGDRVEVPSDASGTQGDLVKINGSGQVTPTTANGDPIFGILAEDSPSTAGNDVSVWLHGAIKVTADGSVSVGDLLQPSGTTNGHAVTADSNEGIVTAVDEGATDTYDIYSRTLVALESASDGDVFTAHLT